MSTLDLSICSGSGVGSGNGSASGGAAECGGNEGPLYDAGSAELELYTCTVACCPGNSSAVLSHSPWSRSGPLWRQDNEIWDYLLQDA